LPLLKLSYKLSFMCASYEAVYLSLGSNLGDLIHNLKLARNNLNSLPYLIEAQTSSIYYTEPQEKKDQPWFANQIIKFYSLSSVKPIFFLNQLLAIEKQMGRKRMERYGPRIIDIDILIWEGKKINSPKLTIPHPQMLKRAFVLIPLKEIAPQLKINNQSIHTYLNKLSYRLIGDKIYQ